jgi:hypothetical protein
VGAGHPGWYRVLVAAEVDQTLRGDLPVDHELGRERHQRQRMQRLGVGEGTDRGALPVPAAYPPVQPGRDRVDAHLRLDERDVVGQGAPPPLRGGVVGLLHHTLAVAPPRRTHRDHGAVVLGHRREPGVQVPGRVVEHRRHPVEAPLVADTAQPAQHLVEGLDQVREVLRLG